jgi:hypothetical protein
MGRILGLFLLSVSVSAAAQYSVNNGYVTTLPSTVQYVPLLAPPNVALPGSGTPTGAPPALGVNDLRTNAVGAIYIPNSELTNVGVSAGINVPSGIGTTTSATAEAAPATDNAGAPTGSLSLMTRFIPDSGRPAASAPRVASLGEIAAQFRSRKAPRQPVQSDRVYTNNDILAMTSTATFRGQTVDVPQADNPNPESDAVDQPQSRRNLQQESNDRGVLDANDHRAVEAAVERNKKKQQQAPLQPQQPR